MNLTLRCGIAPTVTVARNELYFKHIIPLLWSIYDGISLETSDIPNEFISYIPTLERLGVIGYTEEKLCVNIPVLKKAEYDEVCAVIRNATEEIKAAIGEEFTTFISSMKTPIPKHLTSVPELFRSTKRPSILLCLSSEKHTEKDCI